MLRLQLTPVDLCRVRFVDTLHPVGTAMLARQALHDPTAAGLVPALAARQAAAAAAAPVRAAAASLAHLLPVRGRLPDFLTPFEGLDSVPAGLAAIRATPPRRVRAELIAAYAELPATPLRRRFAEADPAILDLFDEAVATWFGAVLAPHWADLTSVHRHQVATATHRLATGGLEGLFAGLHPAIRWRPPVLEVRTWWSGDVTGTGEGLVLLPSPLAGPRPRVLVEPGRPVLLVYPAAMPGGAAAPGADPLGRLLGATRAALLRRLGQPGRHTTTALARAAGVSISTASEHMTALRAAGLIRTGRDGPAVLHRLTPLGGHLLGGPGGVGSGTDLPDEWRSREG
ncbi:ArsR/SmtB family transcription factor [Micromonospora inositola]|uniref:Helix-turn-helix domain-containing protein n=1 Tax=Micromonospora inositola TaxID=47865 RepID=A0A1C5H7L3_9ACTN|nr:winged helix-turn-helix domain-containing protein [Micromonospora inositola]SCG42026.1 Helix-turn-helix domain-containing protein [Micromonospora inositola]